MQQYLSNLFRGAILLFQPFVDGADKAVGEKVKHIVEIGTVCGILIKK